MNVASLRHSLYEFAVELRQLAYTMPAGHENPLVHLSERMVRCARDQTAEQPEEPRSEPAPAPPAPVRDATPAAEPRNSE